MERGDRIAIGVAAALGNRGRFGRHQLEEHHLVFLEQAVQLLVVCRIPNVDGGHQVDSRPVASAVLGHVTHDGGLHGLRHLGRVAEDADKLIVSTLLFFFWVILRLLRSPPVGGCQQSGQRDPDEPRKPGLGVGDRYRVKTSV